VLLIRQNYTRVETVREIVGLVRGSVTKNLKL
jgi:hypothetical protein